MRAEVRSVGQVVGPTGRAEFVVDQIGRMNVDRVAGRVRAADARLNRIREILEEDFRMQEDSIRAVVALAAVWHGTVAELFEDVAQLG